MDQRIALFGACGQVGTVLHCHWGDRVLAFDPEILRTTGDLSDVETVVWCATLPPPHNILIPRVSELRSFLEILLRCEGLQSIRRIVFTSSAGLMHPRNHAASWAPNYYAAAKLASEAFLEAWTYKTGRVGVVLRLGAFNPSGSEGPLDPSITMTERAICRWYDRALAQTAGYSLFNATGWSEYEEGTRI